MAKYPKTIIDETSGVEVPNPRYEAYMDGIREVWEFFKLHFSHTILGHSPTTEHFIINTPTLLNQLQEWGIDGNNK